MADTVTIPRHLRVLAATWGSLVQRLEPVTVTPSPISMDPLRREDLPRIVELASRETTTMLDWINRVTAWCNGPMAAALGNTEIPDADMRRISERLSHFADELSEHRCALKTLENDPAMQAATSRLDAVYASLLIQMREFAETIVNALGPQALTHPNATRQGTNIELTFTFRPDVNKEMANFDAWMQRLREHPETDITSSIPRIGTPLPVDVWTAAIMLAVVAAIVAAMVIFGIVPVLLVLALIGIAVFIIRHPILTLIALLLGFN